jgi:hypothetical protein
MEVSVENKSAWMSLNISPLFFRIVPKLVQALVITYGEIFQTPAVEEVLQRIVGEKSEGDKLSPTKIKQKSE